MNEQEQQASTQIVAQPAQAEAVVEITRADGSVDVVQIELIEGEG